MHVTVRSGPAADNIPFTARGECRNANDTVQCAVPAGVPVDLRFDTPGFAPVYVFDVAFAKEGKDLGPIAFARGASVMGRVVDERGRPVANAEVVITPAAPSAADQRSAIRTLSGRTNARGVFAIAGIPEGSHGVTARNGVRSSARAPLELHDSDDFVLQRPLMVLPPQTLTVAVSPPKDFAGRPWTINLLERLPQTTHFHTVARRTLNGAGAGSIAGLNAGDFLLSIEDASGNSHEEREVTLQAGDNRQDIVLNDLRIDGRVHEGDTGISGKLTFRSPRGYSATLQSDSDGLFSGALPHEGVWSVDIRHGNATVQRRIDVRRRSDGTPSKVDIELAAGVLKGSVVDSSGRPTVAAVRLFRGSDLIGQALANDSGEFVLEGVEPGEALAQALARSGAQSDSINVVISGDTPPVTLTLKPLLTAHGAVTNVQGRGVAGAIIRFVTAEQAVTQVVSGPDGTFEAQLPHGDATLSVVILSGIYPIRMMAISPDALTQPLTLIVGGPGGTLHVRLSGAPPWPLVQHAGGGVLLVYLLYPPDGSPFLRGMTTDGAVLDIEPGPYVVCTGSRSFCRPAALPPAGETLIDLVEGKKNAAK